MPEHEEFQAPFDVTGDEVEYQAEHDTYIARGNVHITQQGRSLTADRVLFNNKTKKGVAIGNVKVIQGTDTLESDFLQFDVDTLLGVVFHGRLDSPQSNYQMEGEEVRKTGDQTYTFDKGRFSTCRCPNPDALQPWTLTAEKADLQVDGYARAHNATFEVLGIPVLWWPYVFYPLKRERETGFLFPSTGSSNKSGTYVDLPFFWAPRDNLDVMLHPEYETRRGFKPAADVEYVFGERGSGELYGTFNDDQSIDSSRPKTPFSQDRWAASLRHIQELPGDAWLGVDALAFSDNLYTLDYRDFANRLPDRYLQSNGLVGDDFGNRFTGTASVMVSQDMQNQADRNRNKVLLQRLPEIDFTALPQPIEAVSGLVASSGIEYTHFAALGSAGSHYPGSYRVNNQFYDVGADGIRDGLERDSNGTTVPFDANRDDATTVNNGTERDGRFEEGEPLADRGQRVLAQPRLAYPMRLADLVEVNPEVGYYGTLYDSDLQGTASRSLFTGRLDLRTEIRGTLPLPFGLGEASHLIEPHITWVGVSSAGQNGNPFFVPTTARPQDRLRELEVSNVMLDPSDRIRDADTVVFGIDNRFFRSEDSSLLGEVLVSSEYQAASSRWGPAVLQGSAQLPAGLRLRFQGVYEPDQTKLTDGLADFGWSHPFGHSLSFGYRYLTQIPQVFEAFTFKDERYQRFNSSFKLINQVSGAARVQLTRQWAVTYVGSYSFENAFSLVNRFGLEYLSRCRCWAARFEVDNSVVRGFEWHLQYRLLGLGDDAAHPFTGRGSVSRFQGQGGRSSPFF